MTHLSDFSYLQRCALEVYIGFFLLYRVWSNDRFRCLHPKRIIAGELRSVITVLYFMMLLMQMSWDVVSTWIKYNESFIEIPNTTTIISKPFDYWTPQHQRIAMAMDYVECVNLSMQTGVFFLLQCFWNYLSNTVAKKSFMSSMEFKFYIFWALGSVAIFPILQWYYRNNENLRETAPQLAYSAEVMITSFLGIRSHFRFKRILNISRNMKHGGAIVEKLAYFKDMNVLFTTILFFYGLSLGTLCVDGLTTAKVINSSKFASDLLIANCNTSSVLMWLVGISIFHPRRSNAELEASIHSNSMTTTTHHQQNNFNQNNNRTGGDVEINNDKYITSNNGSSSFSEGLKVNGHRLSQRITNFIDKNGRRFYNNNYEPSAQEVLNSRSGSFLKPMSPVPADLPPSSLAAAGQQQTTTRSFTPTHQFTSEPKRSGTFSRNIAVEDPYTNAPINFAMMEPTTTTISSNDAKRYMQQGRGSYDRAASPMSAASGRPQQQQQDYPMQTMSGALSKEDFRFDPMMDSNTYDYMGTPVTAKTNDLRGHSNWL